MSEHTIKKMNSVFCEIIDTDIHLQNNKLQSPFIWHNKKCVMNKSGTKIINSFLTEIMKYTIIKIWHFLQ